MKKKSYHKKINSNQAVLWPEQSPLLKRLDIELTERCNNNCIHCWNNLPENDQQVISKELNTEEIKAIIKEAASLGCLSLRFTGGEPLLRKDFEELYVFSRKLGIRVILFTNATLITPRLTDLFSHIPPLEKIEITVYGMKKISYEGVSRILGSFEAAWKGINLLLEKKIPFMVKSALLPANKNEIEEFNHWANSIPWMDGPVLHSLFLDLRCRRDSEKKNRIIKDLRLSPQEALKIMTSRQPKFLEEMQEFCAKFMYPSGEKIFSCGAGVRSGCVDAYGYFQPCLMIKHPDTSYHLKKGSLKEALTDFFPQVRQMKANNPDYLARCARCFLKGLCEQCPARSWTEHGTLNTPVDYLCQVAHTLARYLKLLEKDEKAWEVKNWRERIKKFSGRKSSVTKEKIQEDSTKACNA